MARDIYHSIVREALEKEGWFITHDPLVMKLGGVHMEVDLGAEQLIAAEKDMELIAVEIKSFLGKSKLYDFYEAKGQYDCYRHGFESGSIERRLFLAVEEAIFNTFFQKPLLQEILKKDKISLIIFNSTTKRIHKWIIN
jgi:XisH protein